jgi:MATE family multidrug resistance protein
MSSTYAHYQGPSSLPSDYAIRSLSTNHESSAYESQLQNTVQITRRESSYHRPLHPTIGVYPHREAQQPTETSALLDHPPIEQNNVSADNTSAVNMFWEELAVLTKYAIPVFGYAPSFIFMKVDSSNLSQHSTS